MNIKKAAYKKLLELTSEKIFKELSKAAACPPGTVKRIDIFNTGLTVDVTKALEKYYPPLEKAIKSAILRSINRL